MLNETTLNLSEDDNAINEKNTYTEEGKGNYTKLVVTRLNEKLLLIVIGIKVILTCKENKVHFLVWFLVKL